MTTNRNENDSSKRKEEIPDFLKLLQNPQIEIPLPKDFNSHTEAEHLITLYKANRSLQKYQYLSFIHAGGSGMVFKVISKNRTIPQALKIARKKLFEIKETDKSIAKNLSPVPQSELAALQKLQHPNLVQLYDAIENRSGIIAISTTFINDPKPIDLYISDTLQKLPGERLQKQGLTIFSPERLDGACKFILDRCLSIAQALEYMHSLNMYHFDVKPTNILIDSRRKAHLTDLGACVDTEEVKKTNALRVQFTWTYAHPDLTDLVSNPSSISGGGLKSTADVSISRNLSVFDLFAFGRTIQELLAIIEYNFGERCFTSYAFRYLHTVSAMLLDGHISVLTDSVKSLHGRRFIRDRAMDYPESFFNAVKIQSSSELVEILERFDKKFSWNEQIPELDLWQAKTINTGLSISTPFTKRVSEIMSHPCVRRLKSEFQLGWMREIYPSATHTRWAHTIGVFSAAVSFYNSLLSDSEIPTYKIVVNKSDIEHGLLASLLHDIGQTAFAHDFEAASPELYNHEKVINRLIDDESWGKPTLREVIIRTWKDIDIDRVLNILNRYKNNDIQPYTREEIDGVSSDIIDSPIDADKLDYLVRDSVACNVPYGKGIDWQRFLSALTVDIKKLGLNKTRLTLAFKAKGAPAIESLLLCRYQMYGAVYWHHSYRCIQAMFTHATVSAFEFDKESKMKISDKYYGVEQISELIYQRILCGNTYSKCQTIFEDKGFEFPEELLEDAPNYIYEEKTLEFIWKLSNSKIKNLVDRLAKRELFKRVFEIKYGEISKKIDFVTLKDQLNPKSRIKLSEKLEIILLDAVSKKITNRSSIIESISEDAAKKRFDELKTLNVPLIIIDFPSRGFPNEENYPTEISDSSRKYISGDIIITRDQREIFQTVGALQREIAAIRVFACPEFHELIIRYMAPEDVYTCVVAVIPILKVK